MARYGFAIDTQACIGCHNCAIACKNENNVPDGIAWNKVLTDGGDDLDTPEGEYPNLQMGYTPFMCQHCENPACVAVCPTGATWKDPETGIVMQDYDACIGCQSCMSACPYQIARSYNEDEPRYSVDVVMGDAAVPAHKQATVEKCVMCNHRIQAGLKPYCTTVCPGLARLWGDLDDPSSEVSVALQTREYKTLLPEEGTQPSVYYLL